MLEAGALTGIGVKTIMEIEISLGVNLGLSPRLRERNAITIKRRAILLETVIRKRERTKKIHIVTVICPLTQMKVMWLKC